RAASRGRIGSPFRLPGVGGQARSDHRSLRRSEAFARAPDADRSGRYARARAAEKRGVWPMAALLGPKRLVSGAKQQVSPEKEPSARGLKAVTKQDRYLCHAGGAPLILGQTTRSRRGLHRRDGVARDPLTGLRCTVGPAIADRGAHSSLTG